MQEDKLLMAYGSLEDMAFTQPHWKKWHLNRFLGVAKCGRDLYPDALLIKKNMIEKDEICQTCFNQNW